MKFFPKKLSLKWINQAYDNNELTPYELVDEILKRAEENKCLPFFVLSLSVSFRCRFILADFRQAYPLCGAVPSPYGALASFRKVLAVWVSLAVIQFY